jgi:hypothetical protein
VSVNNDHNLTKLVPDKYRKAMPRLTISAVAYDYLRTEAERMEVDDFDAVLVAVADSAASFATSDYFACSDWFRQRTFHSFKACRFTQDEQVVNPVLVLDKASGRLVAESEVSFDPTYPEERVLAETKVEFFPTIGSG